MSKANWKGITEMSPDIILTAINFSQPVQNQLKEPRPRFVQYYKDLYSHHGSEFDESVLREGSQATYSELGEAALSVCKKEGTLNEVDLMIATYWAYEFDPDHASCGAYLSEKFNLKCRIFDVCEQGTIAPFTAIKIANSFMKNKEINKAIVLVLEQTTIPRNKNDYDLIPSDTGAISIILEKSINTVGVKNHYRIRHADIILDNQMVKAADDLFMMLLKKIVNPNEKRITRVFIRKNSYVWKLFQYYADNIPPTVNVLPFSSQVGCLQPWVALQNEISRLADNNNSLLPNLVIVDQDVETFSTGILTLEPTIN